MTSMTFAPFGEINHEAHEAMHATILGVGSSLFGVIEVVFFFIKKVFDYFIF